MDQRSSAWHSWRNGGLGSSDCPVIMGHTKFSTPLKLWKQKKGLIKKDLEAYSNPAIARGIRFEPAARAYYELLNDLEFKEQLFESKEYPFLRASLDGYNEEKRIILEIKVPSVEVFEQAKDGFVDEYYIWQLEHQLYVADAVEAHFFCVRVDDKVGNITDHAHVIYKSDPAKRELMLQKELEFWDMLQKNIEPPMTDDDALERTDAEAIETYSKIKALKAQIASIEAGKDKLEEELSELKEYAISQMKHVNEVCEGVQLRKVIKRDLDKKKVKAAGIDLSPYERETSYYTLKVKL